VTTPTELDPMEAPLFELLETTESLYAALCGGADPAEWEALGARRAGIVARLEGIASSARTDGARTRSAASRTCLERIAELDRALLTAGREGLVRLQQERSEIAQRRRAVQAHGLRTPELARAVAVKA
jgi:hypothetical protein